MKAHGFALLSLLMALILLLPGDIIAVQHATSAAAKSINHQNEWRELSAPDKENRAWQNSLNPSLGSFDSALASTFSDEFDGPDLDPDWEWIDPGSDCTFDLNSRPGHLRISVPQRGNDISPLNYNGPRLIRRVTGDFIVTTSVTFDPRYEYQGAGILAWHDFDNLVRLERGYGGWGGGRSGIRLDKEENDYYSSVSPCASNPTTSTLTYLKLVRVGDRFYASYSFDGKAWHQFASTALDMDETIYVGLDVVNEYQDHPIHADFDFFRQTVPGLVQVVNEDGEPPEGGAKVYHNGRLAGFSDSQDGCSLVIPDLQVGDKLAATSLITEVVTAKGNHSQDSTQDWAYRVYITSVDIEDDGSPVLHEVESTDMTQTLTVKKSNTLIGFNIVASVEWDASADYLEELRQGFEEASNFLYDAGDGQLLFERVTIYDNAEHWPDADYRIHASNQQVPEATAGILFSCDACHIRLGRYFHYEPFWTASSNSGSWKEKDGFGTMIHEFGHYGFDLPDEYRGAQCTLNRTNPTSIYRGYWTRQDGRVESPKAASIMDRSSVTSEFCSPLGKNPHNRAGQGNRQSCWETIVDRYDDDQAPPRWQLQTPVDRGEVMAGPDRLPVDEWSVVGASHNVNTGTCSSNPVYVVQRPWGSPVQLTNVWLIKSDRPRIYQGRTAANGEIILLGAAEGDIVIAAKVIYGDWPALGLSEVSCPSSRSLHVTSNQATVLILEQVPFTLNVTIVPRYSVNQVEIRIQASTTLIEPLQVQVLQSGAVAPIDVLMTYDGSADTFTGTFTLDVNLPQSGSIEVNATDFEGHSLQVFRIFNVFGVTASADVTVYSADGQVELHIPAGSLSADGRLGIISDSSTGVPPEGLVIISGPYSIQAESGITLSNSVILTMKYLDTGGTLRNTSLSTAHVYHWDDSTEQWVSINNNNFDNRGEVSGVIDAFGIYAAMAERQYNTYLPLVLKNFTSGTEPTPTPTATPIPTPTPTSEPNSPPNTPSSPSPSDGTTNQSLDVDLRWTGEDPDGDTVTYDVYFEANDNTPDVLLCHDVLSSSCDPGTLSDETHYYWQVVARDVHGATTTGSVWNFSTSFPPVRTLNLKVAFQKRDNGDNKPQNVPIKVKIKDLAGDQILFETDWVSVMPASGSDNWGTASVEVSSAALTPGQYYVVSVQGAMHLVKQVTASLTDGLTIDYTDPALNPDGVLWACDVNQDNQVDVTDMDIVGSRFGTAPTDPDPFSEIYRSDQNGDGVVDINDLVTCSSNNGKVGD